MNDKNEIKESAIKIRLTKDQILTINKAQNDILKDLNIKVSYQTISEYAIIKFIENMNKELLEELIIYDDLKREETRKKRKDKTINETAKEIATNNLINKKKQIATKSTIEIMHDILNN